MPSSKGRSGIYRFSKCIVVLVFEYCLQVLLRLQWLIPLRREVACTDPSLGIHITRLAVRLVIYHNLVRLLSHVCIREIRTIIEPVWLTASAFLFIAFWDLKIVLSRDPILLVHPFGGSGVLTKIGVIIPALFRGGLLLSVWTDTIHALWEGLTVLDWDWIEVLVLLRKMISVRSPNALR
jgi:hypothetical protein